MDSLQPEVKNYEPEIALTDFSSGLRFYVHILDLVKKGILKADYLYFEMSGSQPEKIVAEAKKCNFTETHIIKDLNNLERVLKIKI